MDWRLMMNKFLATTASALVLTMAVGSVAEARDGFYVALRGGFTDYNLNDYEEDNATSEAKADFDGVWQVSGALGYKYKYFRIEGEYIYRDASDEDYKTYNGLYGAYDGGYHSTIEVNSLMLNAYVDLMPNYWISPYIMAGIGWSQLKFDSYDFNDQGVRMNYTSEDKDNFSWQWGGGLSLRLNRCLNFDMGYQYMNFNKLNKAEVNAHVYYAGLRYTF